jgi:predicted NUDIX family phosphoesterase
MVKHALVVPRKVLFGGNEFQGFIPFSERDLVGTILTNHRYALRGNELENNSELKQIIPYIWIVNPQRREVFLYQRGSHDVPEGEHVETRYLGKFSGGVGGHIDKETEHGATDPIIAAMMRELREEVVMNTYPTPRFVGYLNDDSDSIGRVHLGLVALAETTSNVEARANEGLLSGRFYSVGDAQRLMDDSRVKVESWTRLSWPFVKDYLTNQN